MSELEHALREALADPPVDTPTGTGDGLADIDRRLRRRQRRRRTGLATLAAAAVAAVVVPVVHNWPSTGSPSSDSATAMSRRAPAAAGGARPAPPTGDSSASAAELGPRQSQRRIVPGSIRTAAAQAASAPGSHASRQVEWVRTTVQRWDRLSDNTGLGPADIAIYVIQLRGHFTCQVCSIPPGDKAPTGIAQVVVIPVDPHQTFPGGYGPTAHPYDLSKLGTVHTFTLR